LWFSIDALISDLFCTTHADRVWDSGIVKASTLLPLLRGMPQLNWKPLYIVLGGTMYARSLLSVSDGYFIPLM
jgi:hypothetical protein